MTLSHMNVAVYNLHYKITFNIFNHQKKLSYKSQKLIVISLYKYSEVGGYHNIYLSLDMRDMNISPVMFKSKLKTFLFMRAFPGAFET